MGFVDVHCHLNDEEFDKDLEKVIEDALKAGVEKIVDCALDVEEVEKSFRIQERFPDVILVSVGFDPVNDDEKEFREILSLIKEEKDRIVAIGEVGLDFYWEKDDAKRELQKERFREFIKLSKELDKPLICHSRSAGKYAIDILIEEGAKKVIMHAFDGRASHAVRGAQHGFYFSIPPSIVRSHQKEKVVMRISVDKLLLESDAPVLAPNPRERNEPKNVIISAKKIAEIKKIEFNRLEKILRLNTKLILGI